VCCVAASALKIKEGEQNAGLEARKAELWQSMLNIAGNPSSYVLPFTAFPNPFKSLFRWVLVGNQLQLFVDQGAGY